MGWIVPGILAFAGLGYLLKRAVSSSTSGSASSGSASSAASNINTPGGAMNGIPEAPGQAREDFIVRYVEGMVRAGATSDDLFGGDPLQEIISEANGHRAVFLVAADALKVDGVRVGATAETQQRIADLLGMSLPTSKLVDLIWLQRKWTLPPMPRGGGANMVLTSEFRAHSMAIDKAIQVQKAGNGILSTVGKAWIIDDKLAEGDGTKPKVIGGVPMACNYGWHFQGATFIGQPFEAATYGGGRLIQGRGFHHDIKWSDYSQTICYLVSQTCFVDGRPATLAEILTSPELAGLASAFGPMKVLRQPGVPVYRSGGIA